MSELPATDHGAENSEAVYAPPPQDISAAIRAEVSDFILPGPSLTPDQFIWPEREATAIDAVAGTGLHAAADAADSLSVSPLALPRIIAPSPATSPPEMRDGDEHWRRQLITALRELDENAPMPERAPSTRLRPPAVYVTPSDQSNRSGRNALARLVARATPTSQASRRLGRALAGATAAMCIFSTGVLWATHSSETGAGADGLRATVAAGLLEAAGDEPAASQPMVNTPVLVREGETIRTIPAADTQASQPSPIVAVAPPPPSFEATPQSLVIIHRQVPTYTVPIHAEPVAAAAADPEPAERPAPPVAASPLDRSGLDALVGRQPTAPPSERRQSTTRRASHAPIVRQAPVSRNKAYNDTRVTEDAFQSRGPGAVRTQRAAASRGQWDLPRHGLRTAPPAQPEPSTLKKLIGMVWPGGAETTPRTAKPEPPAAPAAPVQRRNWSDVAHPAP